MSEPPPGVDNVKRDTPDIPDSEEIRELKHSVRIHLLIMAGPSPQLCAFLVKTIDFIEDVDIDRCRNEMLALSFHIVEAIGIHIQRSIDVRAAKVSGMPEHVKRRSDEILVIIGKSRGISDKIAAKNAVLRAMAEALDALGSFMKTTYPTIFDSKGNQLNNFEAAAGAVAQPLTTETVE